MECKQKDSGCGDGVMTLCVDTIASGISASVSHTAGCSGGQYEVILQRYDGSKYVEIASRTGLFGNTKHFSFSLMRSQRDYRVHLKPYWETHGVYVYVRF